MSEAAMWERLRGALRGLDPVRVENSADLGTPDVNYAGGWIELKWLSSWPVLTKTPVRCDHFTAQQRVWLTKRNLAGGKAFLLLRVGEQDDWLLFGGSTAAMHLGKATKQQLIDRALVYCPGGLNEKELRACLTRRLKG